jgi:glycogen synthase
LIEGAYWRFSILMEQFSLRKAQLIIANSLQTANFLEKRKATPNNRICVIPEARIDFAKLKKTESDLRKKLGVGDDTQIILYVGYLKPSKGLNYLLRCIPRVVNEFPNTVFVLKGEDTPTGPGGTSFAHYILGFADTHDLARKIVMIHDYVSLDELAGLYSGCDVFVFPSLAETFGWPPVEAMACERVVVSTGLGIVGELSAEGLITIPPRNEEALVNGMNSFLSLSGEKRSRLGRANRQAVLKKFSFEEMVSRYIGSYETLAR